MESGRVSYSDARNIPHMQLFHHLKQKFPDLRDNDVNESIQKYGLDRERCEEELSQRTQVHPGGYYGPWGRSSPATSRLTSPVRASTPSTPTTPLLASSSPGVVGPLQPGGEYLVYSPGTGGGTTPFFTSTLATSSTALLPSPAGSPLSYGWQPSVANGFRPTSRQPQDGPARLGDIPQGSRDRSKSRSGTPVTPSSAPVVPNSHDPFACELPERRRSAETCSVVQLEGLCLSPLPQRHAMDPPAGLAATATATTTIITTTTTIAPLTTTTATTTTTSTTINCTNLSPVDGGSSNSNSSTSSSSSGSSGGGGSRSSGRPPPALLQDQLMRKERLAVELSHQVDEKGRLEAEVEAMVRELQAREQQRKHNTDTNAMRIEEVQQENQRLQSECYEMENRILRLMPDFELDIYSNLTTPQTPYNEGAPVQPPPQLTRGSSGSSLGSEMGTPNTPNTPHTPVYPTRPAPPPPAPPPPSLPNHSYSQYQGRGGERVEEASHKWGCTKCTFINHPDMSMCEMCDFPRFTIGTTPSRQTASTSPHHQGPCYCHHRHHHLQHTAGSQEYRGWAMV
ncbi:mitogen-activated protein kinase kinase kinase 7-interacting protein 3 homolog isoform X2 [Portunus trituberculatus]|uniref:mitogen-activated protein kinase kinase kinase 7-interacting protein 3 homolog isoform X2 n=1 Tax=Portunus trituberculatus TaxID=210409 RepID=UPI001E1CB18C|nr:mitogen-activated protein kinase kinase kinase 7-interacting protein 3 homolog isoform X2 [Portunus trituberculatus]XP_045113436.1 mitogen-activated protein kinase kinase kinase 7-interacting protein 3 homolog isoform X2 [Portunus trituberculatus]